MLTFFSGFSLGLSLILAIGSQNAFVLKQGIKNHYLFFVCLICSISDAILIALGVTGFGVIVKEIPSIEIIARYGGASFLFIYSLISFKSALSENHYLKPEGSSNKSLSKTVIICLAFTWLNPHVYLDTVILLGSISSQYQPYEFVFGLGAITASFIFFFILGYGAKVLAPIFSNPFAWKILEFIIGIVMLSIAILLIRGVQST
ncbi:LysE/ArgO family amino acid transporter [Endozoicomonas gorgoniicola]|uniref:LysE/ArgO family amino acid transporter n=1 Tax=Endozoicomonas gorgoniicola TaxID=1234144 RepID=A0ABT3MWK8_9GAMM|nr:LysE/ArgO family amino acid transporter [Endozoicomonas gorgoniicola]MCW7553763.1 LysE/ArgO family amino acid transporter [Endozoicomonas gorgoniicola]